MAKNRYFFLIKYLTFRELLLNIFASAIVRLGWSRIIFNSVFDNALTKKNLIIRYQNTVNSIKKNHKTIVIEVRSPITMEGEFIYKMRNNTTDYKVFSQVALNGEYFPIVNKVKNTLSGRTDINIVDLGANIGISSLFFHQHFPDAKIISIEPEISNYSILLDHIRINDLMSKIIPINKAIWDKDDYLEVDDTLRERREWGIVYKERSQQSQIDCIEAITMETLKKENKIKDISLLKIDIEGAERMLEHIDIAKSFFKDVYCFAIEIHDRSPFFVDKLRVLENINALGYFVFEIGETCFAIIKN
jgi:FkbM family methyltransferase